jgi:hypothetical protein
MSHHGLDEVERLLKKHGLPVTRENYLHMAHMGQVPKDSLELENSLPAHLRDWTKHKSPNTHAQGGSVGPSATPAPRPGYKPASPERIAELMDELQYET